MPSDVNVKVSADNSALQSGLAQATAAVESFKEHAQESFKEAGKELLGAFAVTAIVEGVHSLIEEFGKIQDEATRLNTTAESIQRIAYAAKLSGTNLETVTKGLEKVGYNAEQALSGNGKLAEAFEKLGIDTASFIDLQPEQQLLELAKGFEEAEHSGTELKNAYRDVLGKAAGELIPLLKRGPEEVKNLFDSATVASNDTVAKLKEDEDKLEALWSGFKAVAVTAISGVVDGVEYLRMSLGALGTYLANLPDGFKAANRAANDFVADFEAGKEKERTERDEKNKPGKKSDVEAMLAKANSAEKIKAEEELAKLKEENAKKEEEARFRNLELLQKQVDLEQRIAELKNVSPANETEAEQNKGKLLDYQKELEGVNKEVARDKEKDEKRLEGELKKSDQERAKEALKAQKEALKEAEKSVSALEKSHSSFSVDSLRQIGGGLKGINYNVNAAKDDLQRQQLDYARQQVELQRRTVAALEKSDQTVQSFDGSFN